ncbi:MAG: hypothetical protein RR513_01715 [Muribaculaceae bacterium]
MISSTHSDKAEHRKHLATTHKQRISHADVGGYVEIIVNNKYTL